MKQYLRRFNQEGINQFRKFLAEDCPEELYSILESDQYTQTVDSNVFVEQGDFKTKREIIEYLHPKLKSMEKKRLFKDTGLWSWLSMFYFDLVCQKDRCGKSRPNKSDVYYILNADDSKRCYRHLLRTAYQISIEIPVFNKIYLEAPIYQHGEIIEQTISRLFLMRIPAVSELVEQLYFDVNKQSPKRGIFPKVTKAGDLRNRFPTRIKQLQLNYDIAGLDAGQLLTLLGPEFSPWFMR